MLRDGVSLTWQTMERTRPLRRCRASAAGRRPNYLIASGGWKPGRADCLLHNCALSEAALRVAHLAHARLLASDNAALCNRRGPPPPALFDYVQATPPAFRARRCAWFPRRSRARRPQRAPCSSAKRAARREPEGPLSLSRTISRRSSPSRVRFAAPRP